MTCVSPSLRVARGGVPVLDGVNFTVAPGTSPDPARGQTAQARTDASALHRRGAAALVRPLDGANEPSPMRAMRRAESHAQPVRGKLEFWCAVFGQHESRQPMSA